MAGTATSGFSVASRLLTTDGLSLSLERVVDGLLMPSDIAFAGDGTIFVAERGGAVRAVREGALLPDAALDLRATSRFRKAACSPSRSTRISARRGSWAAIGGR